MICTVMIKNGIGTQKNRKKFKEMRINADLLKFRINYILVN